MIYLKKNNTSSYYPYFFVILSIVAAILQIYLIHTPVVESFLLWFLVIGIGLEGVWGFMGHFFRADKIAKFIGWPKGNPFQKEVAFANLSYGITGIMCFWIHGTFWIAVAAASSIFLYGAAYGHIIEIRKNKNYAPGNAGPVLYIAGILKPTVVLVLLILYLMGC